MVPPLRLLKVEPKTAIKISNLLWGQVQYSTLYLKAKILFVGQSKTRQNFKNRTGGEPRFGQPRGARERAERT